MREQLAQAFVEIAKKDPRFVILSGDHGYALFDPIRKECPEKFINVGVAEQAMVGYAAGLALTGMKPLIYGLAAFVPMRVLEQLRLDVCFSDLDLVILGDGAGLVYSTLGTSHQCLEDIAVTRSLPNMKVYAPCDQYELMDALHQAYNEKGPSYIRLGKADRPEVHSQSLGHCQPRWVHQTQSSTLLVSVGSFVAPTVSIAKKHNLSALSVPQLHPVDEKLASMIKDYEQIICLEEHSQHGGLYSTVLENLSNQNELRSQKISSISTGNYFNHACGSYQYALSEHKLSDSDLENRVKILIQEAQSNENSPRRPRV